MKPQVILGLGQTILYVGFWRNRDENPFFFYFVIGSENTFIEHALFAI